MILDRMPEIKKLSSEEKLQLANELWKEVAASVDQLSVSEEHARLIERRYREYLENPDAVVTWEEIKRRLGKG